MGYRKSIQLMLEVLNSGVPIDNKLRVKILNEIKGYARKYNSKGDIEVEE